MYRYTESVVLQVIGEGMGLMTGSQHLRMASRSRHLKSGVRSGASPAGHAQVKSCRNDHLVIASRPPWVLAAAAWQ